MLEQVKTKLKTNDETLKLVADELIKRCETEPALIEKVLNEAKTLAECWDYIKSEAKKKAIGGAVAISDSEVFGWATHYFWEENLEWKKPKAKVTSSKSKVVEEDNDEDSDDTENEELGKDTRQKTKISKPKAVIVKTKIGAEQLSLFDM